MISYVDYNILCKIKFRTIEIIISMQVRLGEFFYFFTTDNYPCLNLMHESVETSCAFRTVRKVSFRCIPLVLHYIAVMPKQCRVLTDAVVSSSRAKTSIPLASCWSCGPSHFTPRRGAIAIWVVSLHLRVQLCGHTASYAGHVCLLSRCILCHITECMKEILVRQIVKYL